MAKPTGARCNLSCDYCFFLEKARLYPGSDFRMTDETAQAYVTQLLSAHRAPEVTISWQGGEPTLMGIDFFRHSLAVERAVARPGVRVVNTIQTNGVLLDDEWCSFLAENRFLVGISVDGPRHLHDVYRHDKGGGSVFRRVTAAVRRLQRHGVDFNVLCAVSAANGRYPLEVYRFLRDELGARYLQFIPIVEPRPREGSQISTPVTDRSVRAAQYGQFLIETFDEWVQRDVGTVFVQWFDAVLAAWLHGRSTMCVLSPTCGDALALEHNGDVYSCDHFVDPEHVLGNILETPLGELASSARQRAFGRAKSHALPRACRECRYLFTCYGECPKNRVLTTTDGEPGLNWLCDGLKAFFAHTETPMRLMANLLRRGQLANQIMGLLADRARQRARSSLEVGRNAPCPCGSGKKFKRCHGQAENGESSQFRGHEVPQGPGRRAAERSRKEPRDRA